LHPDKQRALISLLQSKWSIDFFSLPFDFQPKTYPIEMNALFFSTADGSSFARAFEATAAGVQAVLERQLQFDLTEKKKSQGQLNANILY